MTLRLSKGGEGEEETREEKGEGSEGGLREIV